MLFGMPVMVKVRVDSTLACICTDAIVAILATELSSVLLEASVVLTAILQMSAVVAAALFVGLMSVGVDEPIVMVILVPAATAEAAVHVMVGLLTTRVVPEQVAPETVTLLVTKPLNAKVLAEGDALLFAAPGNVTTMVPLAGIAVTVLNVMVCLAVTGDVAEEGMEVVITSLRFFSGAA